MDQHIDEIEVPLKIMLDWSVSREDLVHYALVASRCERRGWCREQWLEVWGQHTVEGVQRLVAAGYLWWKDGRIGTAEILADLPEDYLDSDEYRWMDEDNLIAEHEWRAEHGRA